MKVKTFALCWLFLCSMLFAQTAELEQMKRQAAAVRKLPYKWDVAVGQKSREQLKKYMLKMLDEEIPPQKLKEIELTLRAFGLMRTPKSLKQILVQFYSQNVAGFYHPGTQKLYIITGAQPDRKNRGVVVHELIHALQDQHFDLLAIQKYVEGNDDMSAAVSALIEGDATLGMFPQLQQGSPQQQLAFIRFFQIAGDISKEFTPINRNVPSFIQDTMFFNYTQGVEFAWHLRQRGGWAAVNKAYKRLPVSTEQILHPQKYFAGEEPWIVQLPKLNYFGKDWKKISENTLGELGIRILLQEYGAYQRLEKIFGPFWKRIADIFILRGLARTVSKYLQIKEIREAAAGWGGDRYQVFYRPSTKDLVLVWVTRWDTEEDAREFSSYFTKAAQGSWQKGKVSFQAVGKMTYCVLGTIPADERSHIVTELRQKTKVQPFSRKKFFSKLHLYYLVYSLRHHPSEKARKQILQLGQKVVPILVGALQGRNKKAFVQEVSQLLEKITGEKLGAHPKKWLQWWKKKKFQKNSGRQEKK